MARFKGQAMAIRNWLGRGASMAAIGTMAFGVAAHAAEHLPLMPMPQKVERQDGVLRLDGRVAPTVTGCAADMVPGAVARFGADFAALTGTNLDGTAIALTVHCVASDPGRLSIDAREAYRLTVTATGISIDADGETGVVRALATLRQLIGRDAQGPVMPLVRIDDKPRFAWRGLMVDTVRHFITMPTLKRQVDAMEIAKLNVLHLHLSDNEGFRIESHALPRLTSIASHGEYYTQAELKDLVRYAGERGIRVIPEIDLPGHNQAILTAYPELGVAPIDPKDPMAKPKSALNPASEKTYAFLDKLLSEIVPIFPDRQFHVGGDEVSDVAWKDSAEVEAFKKKHGLATKIEVEGWFHDRLRKMLAAKGKSTIGWDEMADAPLPKDVIVQAWRTTNPVTTATAKGHRVIVSAGFYLSDLQSSDWHYKIDLLDPMAYSTMSAQGLANTRRNPVTAAQVSDGLVAKQVPPPPPEQAKLVIGGEGALWGELLNDAMLDGRFWPRGLALGERFWSAADLTDTDDMFARLLPAMDRLRALGLMDDAHRAALIARLAPDQPEPVARLIGLVAPSRVFTSHMASLMTGKPPELIELVDAASTDSSPARRFRVNVTAYLAGDGSISPVLRADLASWSANEASFRKVAAGRPLLERAIPTAQDIAALGALGTASLDAIEKGRTLSAADVQAGRALLAKLRNFDEASKDLDAIPKGKQPPAALIILTASDVGRLLDAAERKAGR